MTFCDFCEKSAKKILKSLVLIRIKALNVKKGRPAKARRFYLRIFFAEHDPGVAVRVYVPIADDAADVIVVQLTEKKHFVHVCHIGYVPPTDATIKIASFKHPAHVCHVGHVPPADVAIELTVAEHRAHIGYVGHIPPADVSIELAAIKQPAHVSYFRHVPLADVSVELTVAEHPAHISHVGHVPLADVSIEFASIKHPAHVGDVRNIDVVQVAFGPLGLNAVFDDLLQFFFICGFEHRLFLQK